MRWDPSTVCTAACTLRRGGRWAAGTRDVSRPGQPKQRDVSELARNGRHSGRGRNAVSLKTNGCCIQHPCWCVNIPVKTARSGRLTPHARRLMAASLGTSANDRNPLGSGGRRLRRVWCWCWCGAVRWVLCGGCWRGGCWCGAGAVLVRCHCETGQVTRALVVWRSLPYRQRSIRAGGWPGDTDPGHDKRKSTLKIQCECSIGEK